MTAKCPWTPAEERILRRLDTVAKIQKFLDDTEYSLDPIYRSPRSVLRDRRAHCMDGGLLAAAAFRYHGLPPLISCLYARRDDDHIITIFKKNGCYGAVAKSNCTGLRFREPVYRTLRELAMSYFNDYFNIKGEKSMRGICSPLNLASHDHLNWMTSDKLLNRIPGLVDRQPRHRLLTLSGVRNLLPVDPLSYKAGFLNADPKGLYHPK